jgi:large subunit ribosomal protein L15e
MTKLKLTEESEAELKRAIDAVNKERLMILRAAGAVERLDKPSKISTARRLGYKEKPGTIVVRVRVPRGGRRKPRPRSGRRPKHLGVVLYTPGLSRRKIAESRALKRYPNMRVLGSYKAAEDGKYLWFEVVMRDESRY